MIVDTIRLMVFPALMAFAASSDLLTMTISNRVSLILAGGFLVLALLSRMSIMDVLSNFGTALAVLVVAFGFFSRGWIGGGDAKLAAATALWLGFDHLLPYLVYASLFGGALTLLLIQFRLAPLPAMLARQPGCSGCMRRTLAFPTAFRSPLQRSSFIQKHLGWRREFSRARVIGLKILKR